MTSPTPSSPSASVAAERSQPGPHVFIQIPCFNEAATLERALADLPRRIDGCARVSWVIVDDGSHDGTADVAARCGVDHIVRLSCNRGLAHAWMAGIDVCLAGGADIIVNTDADNQYAGGCIPELVNRVRAGADMAVGERPIGEIPHFSPAKKALQKLGSRAMRRFSGTAVADAPSGFRAISRETALRMCVLSDYTYTLETLIHAGHWRLRVDNVPVQVNEDLRPSRLVKSIPSYIRRSVGTMLRIWLLHQGARVAFAGAFVLLATAAAASIASTGGWIDGLVPALLAGCGLVCGLAGAVLDGMSMTRRLLFEVRADLRRHTFADAKSRAASSQEESA